MTTVEKEFEEYKEELSELGTYPTEEEYWELREDPDPDGKQVARVVIGAELYEEINEEKLFPEYLIMHLLSHFRGASNENRNDYVCYYSCWQEIKSYLWKGKSFLLLGILSRKKKESEDLIMKYKSYKNPVNQYLYFFNLPYDFWDKWEDKIPKSKEDMLNLSWNQDILIKNYRKLEAYGSLDWLEQVPRIMH